MAIPRFSRRLPHFTRVGKRNVAPLFPPSLYSSTSMLISRPLHSLNPPVGWICPGAKPVPGAFAESTSVMRKLNARYGSTLNTCAVLPMPSPLLRHFQRIAHPPDSKRDELRGQRGRHADFYDQFTQRRRALRIVRFVAFHVVRFFRRSSRQRAFLPLAFQKTGNRNTQNNPQRHIL